MIDDNLRMNILQSLGLQDASAERQAVVLGKIEASARKRLALLVPDMLTSGQLAEVSAMRDKDIPEADIMAWVMERLPAPYETLLHPVIIAVADELAVLSQRLRQQP